MHLERQRTLCLHVFLIKQKVKRVQLFAVLQWGYSRLQGVSGSYRGVQGVAGGYVWLWFGMVTRGHRLQGVSSGYRGNSALEVVTGVTRGFRGLQ